MTVHSGELRFSTEGGGDTIDITAGIESVVAQAGVESGIVSAFVPGSTAAVTTMEHEPGGGDELKAALERLVPAAIRAAVVGPSETVPVRAGRLALGSSQRVVLLDFDDGPRERTVVIQVID